MLATFDDLLEVRGVPARRPAPAVQRRRVSVAVKTFALHALIVLAWVLSSLRTVSRDEMPIPGVGERGQQVLEIQFAAPAQKPAQKPAQQPASAAPPAPAAPIRPETVRVDDALPPAPAMSARTVTKAPEPESVQAQRPPEPPEPPASPLPQQRLDPAAERAVTKLGQPRPAGAPAPTSPTSTTSTSTSTSTSAPTSASASANENVKPEPTTGQPGAGASGAADAAGQPTAAATPAFVAGMHDDLPWAYRWKVKSALAQNRRYPRKAYAAEQQGTAVVRIHLARSGALLDVSLLRSSGHALLDEEALAVVQRVGRFAALDDTVLPGLADFAIDQPIGFELRR